jgi:hypothetical protein
MILAAAACDMRRAFMARSIAMMASAFRCND